MQVVVKLNKFPQIAADFTPALHNGVKDIAFLIRAQVAGKAPIDTGFLRSSPYVVMADSSSYGAIGSPVKKGAYALPEELPPDVLCKAIIGIAANYGVPVEFGTRKMAAQPYLVPAVMAVAPKFAPYMNKIIADVAYNAAFTGMWTSP